MKVGATRDQGQRPTCVAFALSDLHASERSEDFIALSVEYLYYHASRLAPRFEPHSGVTLDQAIRALKNDGQPFETEWPYLPSLPPDLSSYLPPAIGGPVYRRLCSSLAGGVVDSIAKQFDKKHLSMLVFRSSLNFMLARAGAPVTWAATDQLLNPHAVVAVGLGESNSCRFVKIRNSWGAGWADGGYAWLSEEYIERTHITLIGMA